jgi:hypothetical protein
MKRAIMLFVLILFINCNHDYEIEVGSMYDYSFNHDIAVENESDALNYVSLNITYKSDSFDYWQLPEETYRLKTGDCEDFSLLLAYLLETELDIRTDLILIGNNSDYHILVKYNSYYIDAMSGSKFYIIPSEWHIIYIIPYPEAIWMTYYYHDNVGKYR